MDGINENNCEVENDNSEEEEEESVPNESKSDKFVRINYKYSTEQTDQMFSAIETQLQEVKEKFYSKEKQDVLFKFK
mgnify:CR=1 FL=1